METFYFTSKQFRTDMVVEEVRGGDGDPKILRVRSLDLVYDTLTPESETLATGNRRPRRTTRRPRPEPGIQT